MFKKSFISALIATLLAVMSFTTAFAVADSEEAVGIAPYDSSILVAADEDTWEYVYTVDRPRLLPKFVLVTNHFTNPDSFVIQQYTSAGATTGLPVTIAPGGTGTITIMPSLLGGTVELRILVGTTGTYRIGLSEGDTNEDLYTIELVDDSWAELINFRIVSPLDGSVQVTNSPFSPGEVNVRVIQNGAVTGNVITIGVGESANVPISGSAASQDVALQIQAGGLIGIYHMFTDAVFTLD